MKKLLLSLTACLLFSASGWAEDVTYTSPAISDQKLSTNAQFELKWGDVTWTVDHTSFGTQRHAQRNGTTSLLFGASKNNKQFKNVTFSAKAPFEGKVIKSATVKCYTKSAGATVSVKIDDKVVGEAQNIATSATEYKWENIDALCPAETGVFAISFDSKTTTPTALNVVAISVTYGDAAPVAPEAPTILVNGEEPTAETVKVEDGEISFGAAAEGVAIYYNVKHTATEVGPGAGDQPNVGGGEIMQAPARENAASVEKDGLTYTLYTAPVKLQDGSSVISYFARANGVDSEVKTLTVSSTTGIEGVTVEEGAAVWYDLNGVRVAEPKKGLYIRVQGGKATKEVR